MASSTSAKVIRNTLYNYAGFGWHLLASFFLVAYILDKVGGQQFGVFVLMETMVTCLALLDIAGIEGAFVKYIAEYHTTRDHHKLNEIISLGFSYYFTFQVVLCLFIFLCRAPLFRLFQFDSATAETSDLLLGFLFIAMLRGSLRVFRSTLLGMQRMDVTNLIDIIITIPNLVGTMVVLELGLGLRGLILNGCVIAILTVSSQVVCVWKLCPWMRFRPFAFGREIFRDAFYYGLKIQVSRASELINTEVDKLLLGMLLAQNGQIMVGFYELGAKPARALRDLPRQLLPAILPAASQLNALDDRAAVGRLYFRGSKYLALIALPLAFFSVLHADLIVGVWLGSGFHEVILTFKALSIGYISYLLVGMGRLIARGMGIPHFEMRSSLLIAIMNVAVSAVLITYMGFIGALIGTCIAACSGSVLFLWLFHRHLSQPFWQLVGLPVYPLLLLGCILGSGACWVVDAVFGITVGLFPFSFRVSSLAVLVIQTVAFFGIYCGVLLSMRYFDDYDRDVLSRVIGRATESSR